jgi:hypothetical protein
VPVLADALADVLADPAGSVANGVGLVSPVDADALGLLDAPPDALALADAPPPDALGDASPPPPHAAKIGSSSANNKMNNCLRTIRSFSGGTLRICFVNGRIIAETGTRRVPWEQDQGDRIATGPWVAR